MLSIKRALCGCPSLRADHARVSPIEQCMVRPQQIADCRCGAEPGNCLRTCRFHARRCWRRSLYAIYLVAAYAGRTWATGTFYLYSACFQPGEGRADQRLAGSGNTGTASTATISDTPLLEYQRAALAYRHRVAQHDALALISRVGIGAIFFLSQNRGVTESRGQVSMLLV